VRLGAKRRSNEKYWCSPRNIDLDYVIGECVGALCALVMQMPGGAIESLKGKILFTYLLDHFWMYHHNLCLKPQLHQ
jgi:hypothetical protein